MKKFETGFFQVLEDVVFKEVFGRNSRKHFAKYLLEILLQEKISIEEMDVVRDNVLEKISFDQKDFQVDVVMNYKNKIYNIEPFTYFGKRGLIKSESYNGRLLSSQLDKGEGYEKVKKVIQYIIVDNVDISLNKEMITKNLFSYQNIVLSDLQEMNFIRLDKIEELKYNEGVSDKKLILLLKYLKANNQRERDNIVKEGDNMLKEINEFIKRFMKSKRAKEKYIKYSFPYQQGEECGRSMGREEGISIGNRKFARYLQSTGKSIEEISNTMELPISEIQKLLLVEK